MSEAHASRVGHKSMIERNDFMAENLGQIVPCVKAIMSRDCAERAGHNVPVGIPHKKQSDTEWAEGFRLRMIEAQGDRKNDVMARLLGIEDQNTYSKYRNRSVLPMRYLIKFCEICDVTPQWLCEGRDDRRPDREIKVPPRKGKRSAA